MTTEKGYARILGYSLINIVAGFIIAVFNLFKGNFTFKKEYVKYALTFNIPLIPYYLSQTVFNQSDRLMINKMCGADKAPYIVLHILLQSFWYLCSMQSTIRTFHGSIKS